MDPEDNMRHSTSSFIALLLAGLAAAAFAQDDPMPPDKADLAATLNAEMSGEIRVGGAVLDAVTGKPLSGVRLSVTEGAFDPDGRGFHTAARYREEVTGAFRYDCNPCTDVRLRLSKDGYRSQTLNFAVAAVEGNLLDETRLRVALRPLESPVVLLPIQGELVAGADPDAKVLAFDSARPRVWVAGLDQVPPKTAGGIDPFVLRLRTGTGAGGQPLVVKIAEERPKDVPVVPVHERPVGAVLDFSQVGGAVRHEPGDLGPPAALRAMREAPADGYAQFLELGSTTEPVFFYCRVGDRYGKGYVEAPWVGNDGTVRAHVRLWLNDGGQSLESRWE